MRFAHSIFIVLIFMGCEPSKLTPNTVVLAGKEVLEISSSTTAENLSWTHKIGDRQYCTAVTKAHLEDFYMVEGGYEVVGTYQRNPATVWDGNQCKDGWKVQLNLAAARKN